VKLKPCKDKVKEDTKQLEKSVIENQSKIKLLMDQINSFPQFEEIKCPFKCKSSVSLTTFRKKVEMWNKKVEEEKISKSKSEKELMSIIEKNNVKKQNNTLKKELQSQLDCCIAKLKILMKNF
jgi:hypothetical protein